MKLFFLLIVVPMAISQIAIDPIPIRPRPPRPPPVDITTSKPRIIPRTRFVVAAPFRIRQGQPYNVFVTRFGDRRSISVKITITGKTESGNAFKPLVRTARISSGSSRTFVTFDTRRIEKGEYYLHVEGEGYTEKRALTYALKSNSLAIQLNKAIFSPGQEVQGRLFSYNSETNAVNPSGACLMTISDPDGNSIYVNSKIGFTKGKHEFSLQLSDRPPFGTYSISVTCGNEFAYEPFDVDEYKLPAYEVIVSIPSLTSVSDGKVPVIITATYTFGDPVDGQGEFSIDNFNDVSIKRTVQIVNGVASFELDISQLNVQQWGGFYNYVFTMKDSILNSPGSAEGFFQVVNYASTIQITGPYLLTPGSTYTYTISVKDLDGTPPLPRGVVTVTINPAGTKQTFPLRTDGTYTGTVRVPSNATYLQITAEASNALTGYLYAYVPYGGSFSSIGLTVATKEPKLNKWVQVIATVGEDVSEIYYTITSKGVLLAYDKLSFSRGRRTASIWFKPTFSYAPFTQIIAYYVNRAGDFVTGSASVQIRDKLPNYVTLNALDYPSRGFINDEVAPGTNYTFTVESICDSTVSLSAIDQRVLLLKQGNNIEKEEIFNRLFEYQYADGYIYEKQLPNYEYTFIDGGLFVITNIPPPPIPEYYFKDAQPARRPEAVERDAVRRGGADGGVKVRKDFSETFCWTDVDVKTPISSSSSSEECEGCKARVTCKVPESLTKYLIYSVAMNTRYGMGLPDIISNVTTVLSFWMNVDLPYSVQRNEFLLVDIVLFNKVTRDQDVVVAVHLDAINSFEGAELSTYGWTLVGNQYQKTVKAKANENFKVQFGLKAKRIGIFNLKITARGPLAGDGLEKPLRVIPEGIPRTITSSALLIVNQQNPTAAASLQCNYPDGTYEDTKQIISTVIGDILGNALNNLENLIQLPGGCGEQTLLSLVPDLSIHAYLEASEKLTPELDAKLKQYEEFGYQNQLSYRRSDGGFSAFGNNDPASSTWLTAYTVKAFADARRYIYVDPAVIDSALAFIFSQQPLSGGGKFDEPGRVIHSDMQGGSGNGITMTAYISIVVKSLLDDYPQYQSNYDLAIGYLVSQASSITDVYELGIVGYALKLAGRSESDDLFSKFFDLRVETPTTIQWKKTLDPPPYSYGANSLDIEISAYGLKYLIAYERFDDAIKVVKYLMSQSNEFGGYGSSQDTVVALDALSHFARSFKLNSNVQLQLTPDAGSSFNANIDSTNVLTLQQFQLDKATTRLDVAASTSSSGLAVVSLICNYYQDPSKVIPFFRVSYEFYRNCRYAIGFRVCTSYIPSGTSNMAIVRVKMPSGFRYEQWWGGPNNPDVSKVEVTNSGSLVTFYFNTIGNKDSCIDVNAYRYNFVSELKGGTIVVNDYYDTSKEGTASYTVPDLSGPCW